MDTKNSIKEGNEMVVGIMGTPAHTRNRGVLALGTSLINLCTSSGKRGNAILFIGSKNNQSVIFRLGGKLRLIPVVNCRLSPKSRPRDHLGLILMAALIYGLIPLKSVRKTLSRYTPWIATLERTNFVGDIRGGDSFSDIYGMRRFLHGFAMAWTVILVKGSIIQFPQTYGPYQNRLARLMAQYLLRRSKVVMARDRNSRKIAQELLGPGREVLLSPDVAFSLEAVQPETIQLDPPLNSKIPPGLIGINVNGLMYNGGYTRKNMFGLKIDYRGFLPLLIEALLELQPGELWLVPHNYAPAGNVESDPDACRNVRLALPRELQRRVRIVTGVYDQHEIKGVIRQFDFFIGSRMHACIAALSQGIPCVGMAYSMKFEGVFDSVGMRRWVVDCRTMEHEQAIRRILELYRSRNAVRDMLINNADKARIQLMTFFENLLVAENQ